MKRMISLFLCIVFCLASLSVCVSAADTELEGDVWNGSITQPTTLVQVDGVYYYEITKCSELAYVAQTGGDWLGYNYILGNNLILNDVELTWDEAGNLTNTELLLEWTPVQNFSGIFAGEDFIISGLFVDTTSFSSGLFECVYGGGTLKDISIVNAFVRGGYMVGGIVGCTQSTAYIDSCSYTGIVIGEKICGGIVGDASGGPITGCIMSGKVYASDMSSTIGYGAGGICGNTNGIALENCVSTAHIIGGVATGGLLGSASNNRVRISNCISTGKVEGQTLAGGFIGYGFNCTIFQCCSTGNVVSSEGSAGGFIGKYVDYSSTISDCYAFGDVVASTYGGGFAGSCADNIYRCYSLGQVSAENGSGGFIGEDRRIWNEDFAAENCFYLKERNCNEALWGTSIATADVVGEIEGKSSILLKSQSTFTNWDFTDVWSISPDINGGYPYLQWQESTLSDIPVNAVQISETSLSLAEGDYAYLTATVSPANASDQSVTWSSSDNSVATVTSAGKVTAVGAGTVIITVTTTDGGYTATCSVAVTERKAEEYKINSISVRDSDGEALNAIPTGDFLATVSITNLASDGDTLVMLASYTAEGRYKGLVWVSVKDLPEGATIEVTLPVDNNDGSIAQLKAFTIASFGNFVPLGATASFPAQ